MTLKSKTPLLPFDTAVAFCVAKIPLGFQRRVGHCSDIGGSVPNLCADVLMRLKPLKTFQRFANKKTARFTPLRF